jgi:hypothetical protein
MPPITRSQTDDFEEVPGDEDDIPTPPTENAPAQGGPTEDPPGVPLRSVATPTPSVVKSNEEEADPQSQAFAKLLAKSMGDAVAMAINATRPTAATDPTKYPKAKDPNMFSGKRRRYLRTWIGENEICFHTAPNLFRSEVSKVMYAGSFLEGDAKTWFTDYFHDPSHMPAFMSDWALFVIELQQNFGLEDELGAAEEDMRLLTMSDKDHASYFTARFRAIVSNLEGAWDDRNLRNHYYQKIAPRLRLQFVSAGTPVPRTLEPLITAVSQFDRAYWADYELNRAMRHSIAPAERKVATPSLPSFAKVAVKLATNPTAATPPIRTAANKPAFGAHLTKEGKLTPEEKQRRIDAGACFYCGEVGHLTNQCSKKAQARARASETSTALSVPVAPAIAAQPRQTARASIVVQNESDDSGND